MNRAKAAFLTTCRFASSLAATRFDVIAPLLYSQVTRSSHLSHFVSNQSHFLNTHQKLFFSSNPNSVLQLVLANKWSAELETELSESCPSLTHDVVIYVLKKLDKDPRKAWDFFNWVCEKDGFRPSSSVFSLMLRVLVHKNSMKEFWIALRKMKEQRFFIDAQTYVAIRELLKKGRMDSDVVAFKHFYERMIEDNAADDVVKSVVDVVSGSEWSDGVEKELGEIELELSDHFVIRVLKELRTRPWKALRFFHWVGQCSGYEHNTITYNAVARVLAWADSIGEFWSVIEEMKAAGHELDLDTYIKITRQFQKSRMMEDAVKLYELMMDGPYKPSTQDCSMLLRSISGSDKPDLDMVFRVAKKFESAGNTLSKPVYDGIHRSLTGAGRFDEAEEIMKVMRNAGYEPDNITYSQLVFGLCKAKRLEEACNVLEEMEADGHVPDIKTWTILIQGHCAADEVDTALICFAKMMEKGCDADADLMDVLIEGFLRQRKIDGAYKLLGEMVKKARLVPWQATYKNLIENLLEVRKLKEAFELLHLMKKQNYPPYPEPFVQYISKSGSVEDAADFFKALTVKEHPSSAAYVHVLKAFFKEGRYTEAKDLLHKCPHHIRMHGEICKLFGSREGKQKRNTTEDGGKQKQTSKEGKRKQTTTEGKRKQTTTEGKQKRTNT